MHNEYVCTLCVYALVWVCVSVSVCLCVLFPKEFPLVCHCFTQQRSSFMHNMCVKVSVEEEEEEKEDLQDCFQNHIQYIAA